jgi:hypothetical protein
MPIELVTDSKQHIADSTRAMQVHLEFTERTREKPYSYVGEPSECVPRTREVKDITGVSRVVVFDHTLRRREEGAADRAPDAPRQPAKRVHVDQTILSGPQRVRDIMDEQADTLLTRRAAIINR